MADPVWRQRRAGHLRAQRGEDGRLDLVLTVGGLTALGQGDGGFAELQPLPTGAGGSDVALVDLDGDGHRDLIKLSGYIEVRRGLGRGAYGEAQRFSDGSFDALGVLVADGDLDGKPDLYLVHFYSTSLLRNTSRLTP